MIENVYSKLQNKLGLPFASKRNRHDADCAIKDYQEEYLVIILR